MERWEDQMQNRAQFWRCAAHDMAATALTDMESQLRAGLGAVLLAARILVAPPGRFMERFRLPLRCATLRTDPKPAVHDPFARRQDGVGVCGAVHVRVRVRRCGRGRVRACAAGRQTWRYARTLPLVG